TGFKFMGSLLCATEARRQREIESGACPNGSFRPNSAAVSFHYAPDNCKAYSRSLKFLFTMEPLKYLEKLVVVAHIKAGSVVANKENQLAVLLELASNLDFRRRAMAGKLQSISHVVFNCLPKHGLVRHSYRQTTQAPNYVPIASFRFQFLPHLFD